MLSLQGRGTGVKAGASRAVFRGIDTRSGGCQGSARPSFTKPRSLVIMIIPTRVETLMERWPWANFTVMGLTILTTLAAFGGLLTEGVLGRMVLAGWDPVQMVGSLGLHGDIFHLAGNMLFLWVFGNTVCAKVGNVTYFLLYLLLGVLAGAAHLSLDGGPAIGASGAINGIIGFYFMLHPVNRIHCFWWFYIRAGSFDIPGYWLILGWFALDIYGAVTGGSGIAYWAHIGGFLGGMCLGLAALMVGFVKMTAYDNETIVDLLRREPAEE